MATNSSVAGFLSPTSSDPYDAQLDDIFHALIVGLTGITGDLVRPRWQPEPPNQPDFNTNWVAHGVTAQRPDKFAYQSFDPAGQGSMGVEKDELLTNLLSFYGPLAASFGERFRDGLALSQNRDSLRALGIVLVEVLEPVYLPALVQMKWIRRVDIQAIFRRRSSRDFAVLSILSAQGELDTEASQVPIIVNS